MDENKIVVYRTRIEVNNYDMKDSYIVEKTFSIWDPIRHKSIPKGMLYDEEKRKLMLPRGIDIHWLEGIFGCDAVYDKSCDPYEELGPTDIKYLPRDTAQQTALRFMLGVDEYKFTENRTMLSVNLPTGKGKTYCSIATMVVMNLKSIIITNSIEWLKQWKKFILDYTNITEDEIMFISGSSSVTMNTRHPNPKHRVYLVTHATLQQYGSTNGWDTIHELFKSIKVGLKFFDEAHLNFDNMYRIDYHTNTYKTFYVTATPGRSDRMEDIIYGNYFRNVPAIDLFDEEKDPHTEYVAIKYNTHPTPIEIKDCKNKFGFDRNKYAAYVLNKSNFYKLLYVLICQAMRKRGKHLFYIGLNDSIQRVKDWIEANFPDLIGDVGIFTSAVDKDSKNEQLNKKIILSTTKSAGAAVDIEDLVETVNLAEPFKSKITAQQTFGRTRKSGTVYKDVIDYGFSYYRTYFNAKKAIFMKYSTKFSEVNVSDSDLDNTFKKEAIIQNELYHPLGYCDPKYEFPLI